MNYCCRLYKESWFSRHGHNKKDIDNQDFFVFCNEYYKTFKIVDVHFANATFEI